MPLTRRVLLSEGSRAIAVAGSAAVGLLGAHTARSTAQPVVPTIDNTITTPTAIGDFLAVPQGDRVIVFSRRCPHLGCLLNIGQDHEFVCPCHGSRFDREGVRVQGPATGNLSIVATVPR